MSDDNQTYVPQAFVELYVPPGATRPTEPREVIAERHELCEDMAQMLTETARARLFDMGITETDVLERVHRGLVEEGSALTPAEAWWVTGRLAELLGWPLPAARNDPVAEGDEPA